MAQANTDDRNSLNCLYLTIKTFCMTTDTVLILNHTHTHKQAFLEDPTSPSIQTGGRGWHDNAIPANICMVTYGTATTGLIPTLTERDTNRKTNLKLRSWSRLLTVALCFSISHHCAGECEGQDCRSSLRDLN